MDELDLELRLNQTTVMLGQPFFVLSGHVDLLCMTVARIGRIVGATSMVLYRVESRNGRLCIEHCLRNVDMGERLVSRLCLRAFEASAKVCVLCGQPSEARAADEHWMIRLEDFGPVVQLCDYCSASHRVRE